MHYNRSTPFLFVMLCIPTGSHLTGQHPAIALAYIFSMTSTFCYCWNQNRDLKAHSHILYFGVHTLIYLFSAFPSNKTLEVATECMFGGLECIEDSK